MQQHAVIFLLVTLLQFLRLNKHVLCEIISDEWNLHRYFAEKDGEVKCGHLFFVSEIVSRQIWGKSFLPNCIIMSPKQIASQHITLWYRSSSLLMVSGGLIPYALLFTTTDTRIIYSLSHKKTQGMQWWTQDSEGYTPSRLFLFCFSFPLSLVNVLIEWDIMLLSLFFFFFFFFSFILSLKVRKCKKHSRRVCQDFFFMTAC